MKKLLVAGIAAVALLSAPALAAPPSGVFNWTGFYVGGSAGYAWGKSFEEALGTAAKTNPWTIDGIVGGGTLGFNWQFHPNWVVGVEADFSGADVSGGGSSSGGYGCVTVDGCHVHVDWFGTARGRIGFAAGNVLYYGTGGYAYGKAGADITGGMGAGAGFIGSKDVHGWAAGGGIEYALDRNWSAKVEYLRVDLGNFVWSTVGGCGTGCNSDAKFNVVRIGVNYKFGSQ